MGRHVIHVEVTGGTKEITGQATALVHWLKGSGAHVHAAHVRHEKDAPAALEGTDVPAEAPAEQQPAADAAQPAPDAAAKAS